MKKTFLILAAAVATVALGEASGWEFTQVCAAQRWPWQRQVDIDFFARQTDGAASRLRAARLAVRLGDREIPTRELKGTSILGEGHHHIVWTPETNSVFGANIQNASFTLVATNDVRDVGYMTVDLASGAIDYQPMSFSNNVNTTLYKTTSMAFRYIPSTYSAEWRNMKGKSTFQIGSDGKRNDLGITDGDRNREGKANITLTKGYFFGVFPMTRKQYALLGGSVGTQDAVPIRSVTYDGLRGVDGTNTLWYCFPQHTGVALNTPIYRLRTRTGLDFDFPTEAQWEHAARAGSEGEYFFDDTGLSSTEIGNKLNAYGANDANATVGTKLPNAWGIYDLIGCCHQWTTTCCDSVAKHVDAVDPLGATTQVGSGPFRVCKGSHCSTGGAKNRVQRLAYRMLQRSNCQNGTLSGTNFSAELGNTGCRLALTLDVE